MPDDPGKPRLGPAFLFALYEYVLIVLPVTRFKVRFVYAGEGVSKIHAADDDVVALSPMFHDFCGCTQSQYGAVIPSSD